MSFVVMVTLLQAHAGTWTAEDLVTAHARGLPAETVARMAESVGIDDTTTVYLLRRGVPGPAIHAWGHPVSEAEGMAAVRMGPLDAPPPAVADVARVDAAVLDGAIAAGVEHTAGVDLPLEERRGMLVRRGNRNLAVGALLAVAGGVTFAMGTRGGFDTGAAFDYGGIGSHLTGLTRYAGGDDGVGLLTPDPVVMGLGAMGIFAGGLTFQFGARQLALAGSPRDPWSDAE